MKDAIFVIPGGCRTFLDCIDSIYNHIITKLFSIKEYNIHIYMYLKLSDPGPKGDPGWDFTYKSVDYTRLVEKIELLKSKYPFILEYKIINGDELSNDELLKQVKDRSKYCGRFFGNDSFLTRALQCHFNLEQCGAYILDKERKLNIVFDKIVYIRPDLFFSEDCKDIAKYSSTKVTTARGPIPYTCESDHCAIIPRLKLGNFFFDRINLYRNNITKLYEIVENVYYGTIDYEGQFVGKYYIKRE
jgi:hypothetical protein